MSRDKSAELNQEPPPKLRQQEQHQEETVVVLHDHYEGDLVKERRRSDDNEKNHCRLLLLQQKQTLPLRDEGCRTPEQNKIPATTSCPPTPRKRTRRRLTNLEERKLRFFEDSGHRDEVDLFFRSSFADQLAKHPPPPNPNKRRCLSV